MSLRVSYLVLVCGLVLMLAAGVDLILLKLVPR